MKKTLILLGILSGLFLTTTATAQKSNIGVSAGPVFPVGDGAAAFDTGFGFDVSADFYGSKKFNVGVEAGYKAFGFSNSDERRNIVPIMLTAGLHTDLSNTVDFYGELGGGLFVISNTQNNNSNSYGGLSPRVGLAFELKEDLVFLDTNLNYTSVFTNGNSNFNYVGLNVGLLWTIN